MLSPPYIFDDYCMTVKYVVSLSIKHTSETSMNKKTMFFYPFYVLISLSMAGNELFVHRAPHSLLVGTVVNLADSGTS